MLSFNYCDLLAHISYGSVLLFAVGLLNLENGTLFVAAALRTSKGVYALMFWAVRATLKFIVGCNRWDPLQFFRSESQMCVKGRRSNPMHLLLNKCI